MVHLHVLNQFNKKHYKAGVINAKKKQNKTENIDYTLHNVVNSSQPQDYYWSRY